MKNLQSVLKQKTAALDATKAKLADAQDAVTLADKESKTEAKKAVVVARKLVREATTEVKSVTLSLKDLKMKAEESIKTTAKAKDKVNEVKEKYSEGEVSVALTEKLKGIFAYDTESSEWRVFKSGMWGKSKDINVREAVRRSIDEYFTKKYSLTFVKGVQGLLMGCVGKSKWDNAVNADLVPFINGVLNIRTKEFYEHSPEYFLTWQLPYSYDPTATCEPVMKWLKNAVNNDEQAVELIRAFFNAVLTGRFHLQRFLEIDGHAGSGKGTLTRLLNDMIGDRNICVTTLKQLEENRFETAAMEGKRLVQINDAEKFGGEPSVLKAITGEDKVRKERKNRQQDESFTYRGMVLIVANEAVSFADNTGAIPRRRVSIRFDRVATLAERRDLSAEFKQYIPGVLNWALSMDGQAVDNLLLNSEKNVASAQIAKKDTLIQTNQLVAWLHHCIEWSPDNRTKVGLIRANGSDKFEYADNWLYPNYVRFCAETGRKGVLNSNKFSSQLEDVLKNMLGLGNGFCKQRGRMDAQVTGSYFIGLKIASQEEPEFSIVDYAFRSLTNTNDTSAIKVAKAVEPIIVNRKLLDVILNVIHEGCGSVTIAGLNGLDNIDALEALLVKAGSQGYNPMDLSELLVTNYQANLRSGYVPQGAWLDAVKWLTGLVSSDSE